jgi:hypothetical protein
MYFKTFYMSRKLGRISIDRSKGKIADHQITIQVETFFSGNDFYGAPSVIV